jgi:hypothetical protein
MPINIHPMNSDEHYVPAENKKPGRAFSSRAFFEFALCRAGTAKHRAMKTGPYPA